jgi:hypothetical protein
MSGPPVIERALVLRTAPSGESFLKLNVLSPENGVFLCLKRVSKKNPLNEIPDLFDSADLQLETSKQGSARFVGEYRLVHRRSSIGQSYHTLRHASDFCALLALNGPHMAEPEVLYELTRRTLDAFAERNVSAIVLLKALYILLKDEGYPVRESWWPRLGRASREKVRELLNSPTPENADPATLKICVQATKNLCQWLRQETDLMLPDSLQI